MKNNNFKKALFENIDMTLKIMILGILTFLTPVSMANTISIPGQGLESANPSLSINTMYSAHSHEKSRKQKLSALSQRDPAHNAKEFYGIHQGLNTEASKECCRQINYEIRIKYDLQRVELADYATEVVPKCSRRYWGS